MPGAALLLTTAGASAQAAKATGFQAIVVTDEFDAASHVRALLQCNDTQQADQELAARASSRPTDGDLSQSAPSTPWLSELVPLPYGYRTTRRDLFKILSLSVALGSLGVALTRAKAMSFASPKALLNLVLPRASPPPPSPLAASRVPAFKRFIADLERRGSGEAVPEFPAAAEWFNAPPLALRRDLRGRVVVLDFWTYCCINCLHVLPDLAALERAYASAPLTVVGVHSAKFDNEKDSAAVRAAVLRYEITHPVINDRDMAMWRALGIASWPTLAIVSPSGKLLVTLAGEGHKQDVDDFVAAALEYYGERGELRNEPLPLTLERDKAAAVVDTRLRFPGKLAIDEPNGRLFIADSSNNRIVVVDLASGAFLFEVGGAGRGLVDGSFESAAFYRPQGVAHDAKRNCLYVADTENHAVRCVDLAIRRVTTLVGDGSKGRDYAGGGAGAAQRLNSPWDVALDAAGDALFVAMSGQHQVWRLDLATGVCAQFSGSGLERNQNGDSGANTAWAQPSGLAQRRDGAAMYVADSESSSLRLLDLRSGGSQLLAGGDAVFADNLFLFGDRDGRPALLQHPLAVAVGPEGSVYIADSYNHKLKRYDPSTGSVVTVAGAGGAGFRDGDGAMCQFSEPGGLAVLACGDVLVADTNNSVVRRVRLGGRGAAYVTTLALSGVPSAQSLEPVASRGGGAVPVPAGAVRLLADTVTAARGSIEVVVDLPAGYHLTKGTGSGWKAGLVAGSGVVLTGAAGVFGETERQPTARVGFLGKGQGAAVMLRVQLQVYFCQDNDACLFELVAVDVPIVASDAALPEPVVIRHAVTRSAPRTDFPAL